MSPYIGKNKNGFNHPYKYILNLLYVSIVLLVQMNVLDSIFNTKTKLNVFPNYTLFLHNKI